MPLNVKLVVVGGDVKTTEIILKLPSTIGRGRGTTIVLPHPLVSRQHCELFESSGRLMVKDLGSLNGTFVNNERVTESPLAPDELLTVGTVTFRAVYETPAGSKPKPKPGASEKTVPAVKATTIAAAPKPAPPPPADSDSEPLEFNFERPLLPADEAVGPAERGGATHVTERFDPAAAQSHPDAKSKNAAPDGQSSSQPTAAKSPPAKSPPAKSKWADDADDDQPPSSASDDDLNDFLESLDDKGK